MALLSTLEKLKKKSAAARRTTTANNNNSSSNDDDASEGAHAAAGAHRDGPAEGGGAGPTPRPSPKVAEAIKHIARPKVAAGAPARPGAAAARGAGTSRIPAAAAAARGPQRAAGGGPPRLSAARSHELNEEYLKLQEEAFRLLEGPGGQPRPPPLPAGRASSSSDAPHPPRGLRDGPFNDTGDSDVESFTVGTMEASARKGSSTSASTSSSSSRPGPRPSGAGAPPPRPTAASARRRAPQQRQRQPERAAEEADFGFLAEPPADPRGTLVEMSDRPLVCAASLGDKVVIGGTDHALYEVDLSVSSCAIRRRLYIKSPGHAEWVTDVKYLADGRIVSAAMDSKLCVWDSGRAVRCVELGGHTGSVSCIAVHSGSVFLTAAYDKTVRAWSAGARPRLLWSGGGSGGAAGAGHRAPILCLDTNAEFAVSGDRSGCIGCWDVDSGVQVINVKGAHRGHVTSVLCARGAAAADAAGAEPLQGLSPSVMLTGGQDGVMRVWDTRLALDGADSCVASVDAHVVPGVGTGAVVAIRTCAGASCVVTAGADRMLRVFEPRRGYDCVHALEGHTDFIYSMEVMSGTAVSGGGDGKMLFHDCASGRALYGLGANKHAVRCIAAARGAVLAAGDDGSAIVYRYS